MAIRRGDPKVLRLVVKVLRTKADLTQEELGRAAWLSQAEVSRLEAGLDSPSEATLRQMAKIAEVAWPVVVHLTRFFTAALSPEEQPARAGKDAADEPLDDAVVDAVLLAVAPHLVEEALQARRRPALEQERAEAEEIWAALTSFADSRRRQLIELGPPQALTCALVAVVCEASVHPAAHWPAAARELAAFAGFIAERVAGGEGRRSRARGYTLGYEANAQRVATDFDPADATWRRAWELWHAGTAAEPDPLAEWRLLDLEASLRREQHRFSEALDLLDRARAGCGDDRVAAGRILVKKSNVLQQQGKPEAALAVLAEAAPAVEASGDRHLLLNLRFNQANLLCILECYAEAAALLPAVRALAAQEAKGLSLIRVEWLEARVAQGQGRSEEAMTTLERVREEFTHQLPYEAALASLDLAILRLDRGQTADVRKLAVSMAWIFRDKGIHREALAALTLFCEAARQETATVELARQVLGEVEKAQRLR